MLSQSRLKGDGGCFGGDGGSTERLGSTTGGFGLQNFWMHSIAKNAARPASRQRKKYRSVWCQLMFSFRATFAPPKGGERPAAQTPQRGLAGWRRTKSRRAAGCLGPRAGLVTSRQTFVRRCHGDNRKDTTADN